MEVMRIETNCMIMSSTVEVPCVQGAGVCATGNAPELSIALSDVLVEVVARFTE